MSLEALERLLSDSSGEVEAILAAIRARSDRPDAPSARFFEAAASSFDMLREEITKHAESLRLVRERIERTESLPIPFEGLERRLWVDVERSTQRIARNGRHYLQSVESLSDTVPDLAALIVHLHSLSPLTREIPFGIAFGDMRVYHLKSDAPPVYYIPAWYERVARLRPLLLHEFGHVLFKILERKDPSRALQPSARLHSALQEAVKSGCVIEPAEVARNEQHRAAWFCSLGIELCCDAIGLRIGRAAFARAFEQHFRVEWGNARGTEGHCRDDKHPPIHLRMRMLELLDVAWTVGANPRFSDEKRDGKAWWHGRAPAWQQQCRSAIDDLVGRSLDGVPEEQLRCVALALHSVAAPRTAPAKAATFGAKRLRDIAHRSICSTLASGSRS